MSLDDQIAKVAAQNTTLRAALLARPGGSELVGWLGERVEFGDQEIRRFELVDNGPSILVIELLKNWATDLEQRALATFVIEDIAEIRVEHFYTQNVIDQLRIGSLDMHEGVVYGRALRSEDLVLEIDAIVGMTLSVRCGSISVRLDVTKS